MADVNANIGVNIDTSNALAQLKALQRQISQFHSSISKSSEAAALAQRDLQRNFINSVNSIGAFSAELRTVRTTAESFTDSLEKNKFSMREYFRFAGGATKTFSKLFTSEFDTINKVAEENVKRLQTQYIKMGRDASGAMRAIAIMPNELDMSKMSTQMQIAAQRQAIFNQLIKQGSTNLLNFGKNTQWAGRQLMVGFTLPLASLGAVASRTFMDMETAALKFRKVYGDLFTPASEREQALADVQALGESFTKYGIAVSKTVGLAADAAAAGFQGLDLQRQVTEATRLQVLGQVDQQKALETTISLQNAFQMSSADLADSINFLNAVENQTVVSLDDITTAIPKAAPVVKQLGGNVKDLAFFMAAMKEGGINASEGANALKSGLASLINPTDKATEMMKGFGIDIDAIVNKNAGNVKQTVIEFAQALDNLSDLNRQRAIEQLFGKFQLARLSTLFENVTKNGNQASRVLDLATASTEDLASMAESELGMTADSAMNKFRKSVEDLKLALVPVGQTFIEAVTPIVEFVGSLLEKFNSLPNGVKKAVTLITVALGAIGPVALMTFGLIANGAANLIKGLMILRNGYLRLTGQTQILGEQTQFLTVEQQNALAVAHSLDQSHARLIQTFNAETGSVRALKTAYDQALASAARFAAVNPGMMRTPKGYANGIVSVPGPKGAGDIIPAMLSPGEAVIPADRAKKYGALINGIIAGNIPGFKEGIKSMYGGQERFLAPYTMFAPGNTPGGFGMSKEFLQSEGFAQSLRNSAIASGAIEANIRLTDKAILEMAQQVTPFTDQITEQLRLAAKEMADSGKAATHISQLFERKQTEIQTILNQLKTTGQTGSGMAEGIRKLAYATDADIMAGGNVRVPGVDIDEQGRIVRAAPRSLRSGIAARFQRGVQRVSGRLPIESSGPMTRAHVVPESRILAGGIRPIAGGALSLPMETQLKARAELERRSAILSEKLGRSDAFSYEKGRTSAGVQDMYVESRKRSSPHPMASKDGKDDAIAYSNARDQELGRRSRRGRRVATSAGGTVGAGGIIVGPGGGGGGGGGGTTFLGMPGMPERKPGIRQRFGNVRGNFAAGRYAGVGMAATMGVAAASMVPGKTGDIASKIMPAVFGIQALQMALKLPIPGLKLFAGATLATIALIKTANAWREKERAKIMDLADAANLTSNKLKTLGDFFGIKPTQNPMTQATPQIRMTAERRGRVDELKANEGFRKDFGKDIEALKQASKKEAEVVLKSLALSLTGQGFAKEAIKDIVDALREEAGKTDVKIDFKLLDLKTTEGQAQFAKLASDITNQVAVAAKNGYKEILVLNGAVSKTGQYYQQWSKELKPTVALQRTAAASGQELFNMMTGLAGSLKNGTINAEEFNKGFTVLEQQVKALNKSNPGLGLMVLKSAIKSLEPETQKLFEGLKKDADIMLMMRAQALGLTAILPGLAEALKAVNAGYQGDATYLVQQQQNLEKYIKMIMEAAKIAEEEIKKLLGGNISGDGEKSAFQKAIEQLKQQQKELANTNTAYNKLKRAGIDTATAFNIASDPILAAAIATTKVGTAKWKQLLDLIKNVNAELVKGELKKFFKTRNAEVDFQRRFADIVPILQKLGLEANDIKDIMSNPALAERFIKDLKDGSLDAERLKNYIAQIPEMKRIEAIIDVKTVEEQFKDAFDKAMDYFDIQSKVAEAEYKPKIIKAEKEVEEAQKAIDDINKEIDGIQNTIDKAQRVIVEKFDRPIEALQEEISDLQRDIEKNIDRPIEDLNRQIEKLERNIEEQFNRPIAALQEESSDLANDLTLIDKAAEGITAKYDAQEEALKKISDINEQIIGQEKQRISIADALTRGDISAAAQAAQDARAQAAAAAAQRAGGTLQAAREAEIAGLRGPVSGLTRQQIEQRQFQIGQQIFALEEKRDIVQAQILTKQDRIYIIEQGRLPILDKIRGKEDEIYDLTEAREKATLAIRLDEDKIYAIQIKRLEPAQSELEKKEAALKAVESELKKRQDAIDLEKSKWELADLALKNAQIESGKYNTVVSSGISLVGTLAGGWASVASAAQAAAAAIAAANAASNQKSVTGTKVVDGRTVVTEMQAKMYGGKIKPMSYGGRIGSDSVPALLTPGEFVINKKATEQFEPLLSAINNSRYPSSLFKKIKDEQGSNILGSFNNPVYAVSSPSNSNFIQPLYNVANNEILSSSNSSKSQSINNNLSTVYNYSVGINVGGTDVDPKNIARAVINEIKYVDSQRIRGQRA